MFADCALHAKKRLFGVGEKNTRLIQKRVCIQLRHLISVNVKQDLFQFVSLYLKLKNYKE